VRSSLADHRPSPKTGSSVASFTEPVAGGA
jgi:hypothetical protein